ncbi:hypothetical protein M433DRAFT_153567 [Acidomyces richmondensis BFW]|nr:MAG: hypothetical protein FE78DRAFT_90523 [Acidomyces sp. 'richmondensis']KYG46262.1 hypothetical protein M433DRAFT_153567 [Acidomyces richmondensis BFW]
MASAVAAPFDPFEALGLPRNATSPDIKARYRELALKYHPNRSQGSDDAKAALADQFYIIHQAWKYLVDPDKRRRYLELLKLAEEHTELLGRMGNILNDDEQTSQHGDHHTVRHDGYISSDADEDELPRMGVHRRQTALELAGNGRVQHLGDVPDLRQSSMGRGSSHKWARAQEQTHAQTWPDTGTGGGDYFSLRRKKLEKLRRKELAAFERYQNAMIAKFEAEFEVERSRDSYDRAKWKREYFERAPRETADRLRSFQYFMSAFKAFGQQVPRRQNRSTVSYGGQILSTDDDPDKGQFLAPENGSSPSQTKLLHRRGWSSDISGDQTSSDENSSSGYTSSRSGSAWTRLRRHGCRASLDAFQLPVLRPNGTSREPMSHHAPFKMVVKQPTEFTDQAVMGNQDSSPDSGGTTPTSLFPNLSTQGSNGFTVVTQRRLAAIFENRNEHPVPSLLNEAEIKTDESGRKVSPETSLFEIKTLNAPKFNRVSCEKVHELNYAEKAIMLSVEADAEVDPVNLTARLSRLDRNVAEKFMIKPDAKESFRFRLIYDRREVPIGQRHSFIALSYRRKRHVEKQHGCFTLPLDPAMFQAVWDERNSETEGVWIDQISIDQDSRLETTISMSAMDMVYRSARLVVIALDDIELDPRESEILKEHMDEYAQMLHVPPRKRFRGKQPPYLDTHEDLYMVLQKILRSSWFKRAWCRHEMRLARDHVFLIPCKDSDSDIVSKVVRFTSHCFTHLMALATEVPFESDIELVKPPLHAFFRDRSKLRPSEHLKHHHGNFTTVVAEVFGMEAGGDPRIPAKQRAADAMKDKISIILNTMECGLALTESMRHPSMPLTKSECHYMLLILALAAQDPGALCSVGPPMRLVQADNISPLSPNASSTWLFEPTNVDSGLNNYRTLNRLPASATITTGLELGEHYVQLDLKFLTTSTAHTAFDNPESLKLAQRFMTACTRNKFGRNRQRYLITDSAANRHFGDMRHVYEQTLACVFECGPDWLEDICHRYGVSRWKQNGESAWNLLVALKSTDGRWPEHAWSAPAAGFVMDFVNFLVIRGMPQRQIIHQEEWRPIWVPTANGGKLLTFVPPGQIRLAVPTALLDPDYVHLARLWVLETRPSPCEPYYDIEQPSLVEEQRHWTLLGKSILFTDNLASQLVHSKAGHWYDNQKVFGREDPEIQRLLRERSLHI